ncbi:glycoside hydrolase family 6 protein [Amycolatopsis sp. GM8]|uniref:glycoside hydrolase family 6 protein n=1 Tax=Amycolatopsis sp. GM8 TaxID=2896530 RepID=UPI001F25CEA9|nr:glycoside hydrolase family 6 protein [Amycolatopsis sp. GM8]
MRALVAGIALLLAGCAAPSPVDVDSAAVQSADGFYLDRDSPATRQEAAWRAAGRWADANEIDKIARRPQAVWVSTDLTQVETQTRDLITRAAAAHQTAILVAYDIPHRDCDGYSAGGARDATTYRAWIAALLRGIGESRPVVILEPDAVPAALGRCLSAAQRTERFGLLAESGAALAGHGARVYLDAGHPGWITDTTALADTLRQAGIAQLAGFSLNVSNFYSTADVTRYGHDLSARLGGAHFVIDTSRNGNGPAPTDGTPAWCNPPGRALGQAPTTTTGDPAIDAFLWIKNPGTSDGACRAGAPPAGQWWADYALRLAQQSP